MKVRFTLKNAKDKDGGLIVLTVSVGIVKYKNGKRIYNPFKYSTGIKIPPQFWNPETYRVKVVKRFPMAGTINKSLAKLQGSFTDAYYTAIEKYDKLTHDNLRMELLKKLNKLEYKSDFFSSYQKLIDESKSGKRLVKGKRVANQTIHSYTTTGKHLYSFNPALSFSDIDIKFYNEFLNYFYKKGTSKNTIGVHIKNLKTFMGESLSEGLHNNIGFKHKDFLVTKETTTQIYITESELQKIINLNLTENKRLERVRDIFIIGCYTGLRYSDWYAIKQQHIFTENNRHYLRIGATFKTGEGVIIPLTSTVISILEKYNYRPRSITNSKFNDYIKEVAQLIGMNEKVEVIKTTGGKKSRTFIERWKLVKTHSARRTAATNMYLAGIDTRAIMKITGHKTESSFYLYIRVSELENAFLLADSSFFNR